MGCELPLDEGPAPLSGNKAIEDADTAFVLDHERGAGRTPINRRYEAAFAADIELLLDWELASTRKPLNRIDPLR